jgi:flagellar protein FlaG
MLLPAIRGVSATADVSADVAKPGSTRPSTRQEVARIDLPADIRPQAGRADVVDRGAQEALDEVLTAARERALLSRASLEFSIDDASGRTVVKVVDAETKELIRQIPSEEVLALARNLERIEGLLLRDTA